jgi:hypothetical protein
MPRLRGHHLVCLHFFHGEGYDKNFIKNLKKIISLAEKETVTISSGADDICKKCINLKKGRCESSDNAEKAIQKMDIKALALLGLSEGDKVKWAEIKDGAGHIFSDWYFQYCSECQWKETCERDDYFKQLIQQL